MLALLELVVPIFVQRVDERDVTCTGTFVWVGAVWYQHSSFDGSFVLYVPDLVEPFRIA